MIKTKFVFAVSIVAIFAVNVANAKIAATSYVDEGVQTATDAAGAAQISADTANTAAGKAQKSADDAQESADAAAESAELALATLALKEDIANKVTSFDDGSASDVKYPSTSAVKQYVSTSTSAIQTDMESVKTALAGKQATISDLATIRSGATAGATALQKADITTGTSNGTISVDGTNVAVRGLGTAAYTASTAYATSAQGTLADTAVQPGDLADVATSGSYNDLIDKPTIPSGALASKSTITNADVAGDAEIAQTKISGLTDALAGKQDAKTAVTHTENTAVGSASVPVYVGADGKATVVESVDSSLLPSATTNVKGAVSIGSNINVTEGKISVPVANGTTLGVVKQGTNTTITSGAVNVATANGTTLGVVKQGTNTTITSGAVNVATANGTTLGVVKAGTNTTITSGAVNVATASATTPGVMMWGQIPSGSATSTTYATIWVE